MQKTLTILFSLILLLSSPFSVKGATNQPEECNLQSSLEALTVAKEDGSAKKEDELETYKTLLEKVFACSLFEVQNLKTKLEALRDLNLNDTALRDEFLATLGEFELYYLDAKEEFETEEKDITELKQFALKLLTWRKEHYSESAKRVANFIFIFQGRSAVGIADTRLKKISLALLDAGLLFRRDTWKEFRILLNEAQEHIKNAEKLNREAYELFTTELEAAQATSTPETAAIPEKEEKAKKLSVTDILKESLTEIRETYKIFSEIGKIVKKILG